ncbi:hypothetical protein [Halovulum sp. GXIMD14793]
MPGLLLGIMVGASVFAATLFSGAQVYLQKGRLRWAHLVALALTVLGMATLSAVSPGAAMVVGVALIIAGLAVMALEDGWNRILPVFQIIFGGALVAGVPFAG